MPPISHNCPSCGGSYRDILEHIRKKHPDDRYTASQLQPLSLVPCPICATACRGTHGVNTHSAKIHGTVGTSKVSTPLRTRTPAFNPAVQLGSPARHDGRKRAARTLSPTDQPPLRRARPRRHSSADPGAPHSASDDHDFAEEITVKYSGDDDDDDDDELPPMRDSDSVDPSDDFLDTLDALPDPSDPPEPPVDAGAREDSDAFGSHSPIHPAPSRRAADIEPVDLMLDQPLDDPLDAAPRARSDSTSSDLDSVRPTDLLHAYEGDGWDRTYSRNRSISPPRARASGTRQEQAALEEAHREATAPILARKPVQRLLAFSKVPVPEKRIHPRQATLFTTVANDLAGSFLARTHEANLFPLLILPRVLGLGLLKDNLAATLRGLPENIPFLEASIDALTTADRPAGRKRSEVERATEQLERGFLGRAAKVLIDGTKLAAETPDNLALLREKHPIGPKDPFRGSSPYSGEKITLDNVVQALASIGKEKAPGLSGWTRPLLDLATHGRDSQLLAALRLLADMIRQGTAPGMDLLCPARLIGLEKKDGGVRPIAVGDMLYRVAMKAILIGSYRPQMLLPSQLGLNSHGGVEPAVFLLQEAIMGRNANGFTHMASLDLSNAFNSAGRCSIAAAVSQYAPTFYKATAWAYNTPSLLVTEGGAYLASADGVRQGDPLGPLLFSLAVRPTLETLAKALPTATLVAYLDGIYVLNKRPGILEKAAVIFEKSSFSLNIAKSKEYPLKQLRKDGIRVLGSFIGPEAKRSLFLAEKTNTLSCALMTLLDLPKQHAFLILGGSVHLLLRHLLRRVDPEGMEDRWGDIDRFIEEAIGQLAARDPYNNDLDDLPGNHPCFELIGLPVREGGLGIPAHAKLAEGIYEAARAAAQPTIDRIMKANQQPYPGDAHAITAKNVLAEANKAALERLGKKMTSYEHRARLENASYLGRKWVRLVPTDKRHQLSDTELTEALRNRLLLPVKPPGNCGHCGAIASLGHEDVCRAANRRWISRHSFISRAITKTLTCRERDVEAKPLVSRQNDLRADFALTAGNTHYYYNVQVVAVNKDSAREDPYETLREAAEKKRLKYKELGASFRPLIFSAGGLMEKDTAKAYKELQTMAGPTGASWLDASIGLALTKTRASSATSIAQDPHRGWRN